ncbi:MAG: amidophosphoribosyltransferase [Planctomycetota bacterium]
MGEAIKHECGVAVVRLRKPLAYYRQTYGSAAWGLNKLYLLMEKQRNRGQDGVGIAACQLGMEPGAQYMDRLREGGSGSLDRLWQTINTDLGAARQALGGEPEDAMALKRQCQWVGECLMGHLRYGTRGGSGLHFCHPMVRNSNWATRRMMVAGNFNLTNTRDIFDRLVQLGQHPVADTDTMVVMEKIAYFLDEANNAIVRKLRGRSLSGMALTEQVIADLDMARVLHNAAKTWDGGYCMTGMLGYGLMFALRDPGGIRPAYWYVSDEVVSVASERAALVTCFNVPPEDVQELPPGHALIVDQHGDYRLEQVVEPQAKTSCSFERIYFSRGNDLSIYQERKRLGQELLPAALEVIDGDLSNTVFGYVPNTAEISFYGLVDALKAHLCQQQEEQIARLHASGELTPERIHQVLSVRVRTDKVAHKDAKLRTFISDDSGRKDLVSHAYDISRGTVRPGIDNLVMIDDSIVRGTTLRESLLRILLRLKPRQIIILSSAPQIRYPDCYGIDMSELGRFIAFEAAISLLREQGRADLINQVYQRCCNAVQHNRHHEANHVRDIYGALDNESISRRISDLVRPDDAEWDCPIRVIYQSVEGLRRAIPEHTGDWYFTGNYPTQGGNRVVNQALINYMEHRHGRSY